MCDIGRATSQFIPVIVGDKRGARTARRLFLQYGLSSHLFISRPSLLHRLTPWLICHRLPVSPSRDLTVLALCDLAAEIEAADRTPLLYLCDGAPPLGNEHLRLLEGCYIICHENDPLIIRKGGQAV